ncbi:polysaccharide pyruvyl transferase family protein [Pseudorhodoferax sp. Leaf265]|uniref:polysaccharide pyruvyl transferase family protein n=1 Tax=Pseudorhodoferax sp. Leaf265 TaxID=1736315 RepID=UPI000DB2FE01|nr:polysaccharide pyruvyl transferase family protein [Pseudorhodoferax sp. Leaf265]PZP96699.1 MAG: polysaccharide pyruvyl transferase [Variovorax paradoxus]PZQ07918.1 MAG: polysaccharide pyruvyl transferase [Variovorax paradoxus]
MLKLFYYRDGRGNFGDDLNPWIWYSLYPGIFDDQAPDHFLGIGTLINDRAPRDGKIWVCGSGAGYHGAAPVSEDWSFVFVRGPKTAARMNLPVDKAITDPGILVADLLDRRPRQASSICYMPHHDSIWRADWRAICKKLGLVYLDPADDIHETMFKMCRSKFVIAEAMHAAIVADALRIPWVPVKAYSHILDFKWQDWAESLALDYQPETLPEVWDVEQFRSREEVFKSNLKKKLMRVGMDGSKWTPPLPDNNADQAMGPLLERLADCRDRAGVVLSPDHAHHEARRRILATMDEFAAGQHVA